MLRTSVLLYYTKWASERCSYAYILGVAFIIACVVFFPLSGAGFWLIDDHGIVSFSRRLHAPDVPFWSSVYSLILETEVGRFPEVSRFRPVYFVVRVLQSAVLGLNSNAWFLVNAATLFCGVAAFGCALRRFFPSCVVITAMASLASFKFNKDLWARLGPAEIGAFGASMFFLLGLASLRNNPRGGWFLCCASSALAIGYKENFIFYLVPLGMALMYLLLEKRASLLTFLLLALPLGVALPVGVILFKVLIGDVGHIYRESVSVDGLRFMTLEFLVNSHFAVYAFLWTALCIVYFYHARKSHGHDKKIFYTICLVLFSVIMVDFGNYFFYQGNISSSSRYAFPYDSLLLIGLLSVLFAVLHYANGKVARNGVALACIAVLFCMVIPRQIWLWKENKAHHRNIAQFQEILSESKAYSQITLITAGQAVELYEPYFSLQAFSQAGLAAEKVTIFPFGASRNSALDKHLGKRLDREMAENPFTGLDSQTLLVAPYSGGLKKIEFLAQERRVPFLATSPSFGLGNSIPFGDMTVFIPVVDRRYAGVELRGDVQLSADEWRFFLNDEVCEPSRIAYGEGVVHIPFSSSAMVSRRSDLHILKIQFVGKDRSRNFGKLGSLVLMEQ